MKRSGFLRIPAAVLCAVFSVFCLSCCDRRVPVQTETATETENKREPGETVMLHPYDPDNEVRSSVYLREAPARDLGGTDIFFTGPQVGLLSPDGAAYISKEIAARNAAVEKKLSVKLNFSAADEETMFEDAAASVASGLYYTDVMLLPVGAVGKFYAGGCLFNLSSLPFFDLTRPYFDGDSATALSAGNYTLAFSADACPTLSETPALFYNKKAADQATLERAAAEGTLTWDLVFETASGLAGADGLPETVLVSGGAKMVSSGRNTVPSVALDAGSLAAAAAISEKKTGGIEEFNGGGAPFYIDFVKNAALIDGENVGWGILPVPKTTPDGEYRSLVSRDCPVFTVVAGTKNSDEIGLTLTAFCAASFGVIPEHYVDKLIVTEMRDDGSGRMLDIIRKTAVFDLALAFSEESEQVRDATVGALRRAAAGGSVDIGAFAAEADTVLARLFE